MATDISRNTIFVLVILTLIVSVLGMWTVLSNVPDGVVAPVDQGVQSSNGKVSLKIIQPPEPSTDLATGQVALKIEERS